MRDKRRGVKKEEIEFGWRWAVHWWGERRWEMWRAQWRKERESKSKGRSCGGKGWLVLCSIGKEGVHCWVRESGQSAQWGSAWLCWSTVHLTPMTPLWLLFSAYTTCVMTTYDTCTAATSIAILSLLLLTTVWSPISVTSHCFYHSPPSIIITIIAAKNYWLISQLNWATAISFPVNTTCSNV